jgi:hypothetical protein
MNLGLADFSNLGMVINDSQLVSIHPISHLDEHERCQPIRSPPHLFNSSFMKAATETDRTATDPILGAALEIEMEARARIPLTTQLEAPPSCSRIRLDKPRAARRAIFKKWANHCKKLSNLALVIGHIK